MCSLFFFLFICFFFFIFFFFFSSRRRHTRCYRDWSSDVCSSDLHAYFPTSLTNLHSPHSRVFISPPTFSTSVSTWFTASPIGTTIRPPSASCWKSGGGTAGPPAVTRIRSNGASSGHPSVPLPTRTH